MDLEDPPDTQEVLAAVRRLRTGDGEVPMQLDLPWETLDEGAPAFGGGPVVVVDTNILIGHLALLRQLIDLASSPTVPAPHRPLVLIPRIVVAELDRLKTSSRTVVVGSSTRPGLGARTETHIAALARAATNWLLDALAPRPDYHTAVVRGQRKGDTLFGPEGPPPDENNDTRVLDAALFHAQARRTVLLTNDRNLRVRAAMEEIEALGMDEFHGPENAPLDLLERLSPGTRAAWAGSGLTPPAPLVASPRKSRPTSTPLRSRRRWSPPSPSPRPAPLPPDPPLGPTHACKTPTARSASALMELDPPTPPPLYIALAPPPLRPIQTGPDLFRAVSTLLAHFVALALYRHVFEHLRRTRSAEQGRWQVELGDWREWTATGCVEAARRWWEEGDVVGLCRVGLEAVAASSAPTSLLDARPPEKTARSPRTASSDSRWAPSKCSRAPLVPMPFSSTRPTPLSAHELDSHPSVERQLRDLYTSLPSLASSLAVPADSTATWSAPRWEVLLEAVAALLLAVLGGAVRGDVRDEVQRIVTEWTNDLARLGIPVRLQV